MKLSEREVQIVTVLNEHDGIHAVEIAEYSRKNIPLGSLHTTLYRLSEKGLVRSRTPKQKRRPIWLITAKGRRVIENDY